MRANAENKKITLSVDTEFKKGAIALSKFHRRSISKLFEDWVQEKTRAMKVAALEEETLALRQKSEIAAARKAQKHKQTSTSRHFPPKKHLRAA